MSECAVLEFVSYQIHMSAKANDQLVCYCVYGSLDIWETLTSRPGLIASLVPDPFDHGGGSERCRDGVSIRVRFRAGVRLWRSLFGCDFHGGRTERVHEGRWRQWLQPCRSPNGVRLVTGRSTKTQVLHSDMSK